MRKWIALMVLPAFLLLGEITQIESMQDMFRFLEEADSQTLVIFDVDMVLVQPSDPAFQMANMKKYSAICKEVTRGMSEEQKMVFLSLMSASSPPQLIDPLALEVFENIASRGLKAMALTANLTGELGSISNLEKWRVEALSGLGIDFSRVAPYGLPLLFDDLPAFRGHYSTYASGILFVNGTGVSKGKALLSFFSKTHLSPRKVIFIDDREDNLKSVEDALAGSVEYAGLHYLGAQKYPSLMITEEEFSTRWKELASKAGKL